MIYLPAKFHVVGTTTKLKIKANGLSYADSMVISQVYIPPIRA
jgi:hypothetical protein